MKSVISRQNIVKTIFNSTILLGLIVIISLIPRLFSLSNYPPIIIDEPANIRDIDLILQHGLDITDFHWDYSKSRMVHFLPVLLIKLGIDNKLLALRYSSVILSIASLFPFYWISKKLTNKFFAFSTTLLYSLSYFHLQFSRVGWTDIMLNNFLGLTLFYLITVLNDHKKYEKALLIFIALLTALIFYSYRSGIVIISVGFLFLITRLYNEGFSKKDIKKILIFAFSLLLFSLPWLKTISENPEKYNLRLRYVSVNSITYPYKGFLTKSELILDQVNTVFNSWVLFRPINIRSIEEGRYLPTGYSIINILITIGFWVGLLTGILHLKKTYPIYIIILMGLIGQIITLYPPNGARGLIMLPCIYLLFAFGSYKVYIWTQKSKLFLATLIVVSIIFAYFDVNFYFYWMKWINV